MTWPSSRVLEQDLIQELRPKFNKELRPYSNKFEGAEPTPEEISLAANTLIRLGIKFAN